MSVLSWHSIWHIYMLNICIHTYQNIQRQICFYSRLFIDLGCNLDGQNDLLLIRQHHDSCQSWCGWPLRPCLLIAVKILALNANRSDIIAFTSILTSKRIMLVSDSIYHLSTAARLKDVIFLLKTKQITV